MREANDGRTPPTSSLSVNDCSSVPASAAARPADACVDRELTGAGAAPPHLAQRVEIGMSIHARRLRSPPDRQIAQQVARADIERIIDTARADAGSGLRVELGGDAARGAEERGEAGEGAGLLAALVILVMLFGSLVAASLPIVTAVFAVGSALGVIDARGTELDARSEVAPQRTC